MIFTELRECSAEELTAFVAAYPRRLWIVESKGFADWVDRTIERHGPSGQLVASRRFDVEVGERCYVRPEVPPSCYRVRPDGTCDHEWHPAEHQLGMMHCDFCDAEDTIGNVRDEALVQKGEQKALMDVDRYLELEIQRLERDPHSLADGFLRTVASIAETIRARAHVSANTAAATGDRKVCPTCCRARNEQGHEPQVRQRREMTPVFDLPAYSDSEWIASVTSKLATPTRRRDISGGVVLDFGDVRVTCKRGDRTRVEDVRSGSYALVDPYGPANVVAAEIEFLLAEIAS